MKSELKPFDMHNWEDWPSVDSADPLIGFLTPERQEACERYNGGMPEMGQADAAIILDGRTVGCYFYDPDNGDESYCWAPRFKTWVTREGAERHAEEILEKSGVDQRDMIFRVLDENDTYHWDVCNTGGVA